MIFYHKKKDIFHITWWMEKHGYLLEINFNIITKLLFKGLK